MQGQLRNNCHTSRSLFPTLKSWQHLFAHGQGSLDIACMSAAQHRNRSPASSLKLQSKMTVGSFETPCRHYQQLSFDELSASSRPLLCILSAKDLMPDGNFPLSAISFPSPPLCFSGQPSAVNEVLQLRCTSALSLLSLLEQDTTKYGFSCTTLLGDGPLGGD